MEKKGKSNSNPEKGKQSVTTQTDDAKEKEAKKSSLSSLTTSADIMEAIKGLQSTLAAQTKTLTSQDEALKGFSSRLEMLENNENYEEYDFYDPISGESGAYYGYTEESMPGPSSVPGPSSLGHGEDDIVLGVKRKQEDPDSRFVKWAKRYKTIEPTSEEIDETLANTVSDLFRNGIDEKRYNEMVLDENTPRPINCDGLVTVKMNSLIWDSVSAAARARDSKLQKIETSVVKAAVLLTKMVHKMAKVDSTTDKNENRSDFGEFIDSCNDVLALMGHANKQINLTRKDLLRPEIAQDYAHLCNHNRPISDWLFGDDVSKSAKEIEDCSKISGKISKQVFRGRSFRGRAVARSTRGMASYRSQYPQGYNTGQGYYRGQTPNYPSKNLQRGYGRRPQRRP